MRATILSDNIPADGLEGEWGLSVYIEYAGRNILLDSGASDLYLENAKKLGIGLEAVDYAVLSHGHSDHSDGMAHFFRTNPSAPYYVRPESGACYMRGDTGSMDYAGIPQQVLKDYPERLVFVDGVYSPSAGVWLVPHTAQGLGEIGKRDEMYVLRNGTLQPDDFAHEQSLVFETEEGLVIFNSCSHGGADTIISETAAAFPGKPIRALIGGFHLYARTDEQVRALAGRLRETGVAAVYTGHCTGERALAVLTEELGGMVHAFHTGLVMEF